MSPLPIRDVTAPWGRACKNACAILEDAFSRFAPEELALAWTGGKDSTLLVCLALAVSRDLRRPAPRVVCIDEGDPFPEILAFVDRIGHEWDLDVAMLRNEDLVSGERGLGEWVETARLSRDNRQALAEVGFEAEGFVLDPESFPASHLCKTVPLKDALVSMHVMALATAIRWDEHPARAGETAFSPRSAPPHIRVHPLLSFTERDIWMATHALGVPYCSLYRDGYRSLGTRSGTVKNADIPAWEQDLEKTPERLGRHQGKEDAMAQLRALGYM